MSELSLPVGAIFDHFSDPVLLLEGGYLRYRNPAAAQLPGLMQDAPIPEEFSALPEDGSGLMDWGARSWLVFSQRWEHYTLIRLTTSNPAAILPDHRIPVLVQKLRTPLTSLTSSEELLAGLLTPEQRQAGDVYLARTSRASLRLMRMLRSLELAALPSGEPPYGFHPEPLNLNELLREAYRQLSDLIAQTGCSISFQEAAGNCCVCCDEELLFIQIYHLVSNGLRAAGQGGHLLLRLEHTRRLAMISVEDDGPSLTPLELSQLFNPAQGGDGMSVGAGLGLGITVCRKIAQLHQGSLLFANCGERGVRATLSLPLCRETGGMTLHSARRTDATNGVSLVLRELSDVLPEQCFRMEP